MIKRLMAAGLALGSMLQVGCTSVRTQMLGPTDNRGIVYYLPKGVTTVTVVEVKRPDKTVGQALRLGETAYLPDTNQAYCLNHKPSVWADDDLKVTLSPEGLLSRVDVTTQDRAADVVVQIAKAAAALAPGAVGEETVLYAAALDLTDRQAVDAFNTLLAKHYTGLKLAVDAGALAAASPASPRAIDGVYYRPVCPVKVTLTQDRQVTEQILLLPNQGALITLPITRNAFVKKVTQIEFEHGLLKKVALNKPSEVRGAVSLPIEIGKAIVSIPAELIQLKINCTDKEEALLAAEKSRLAAEEKLQALRREYQRARDNPME